MRHLGEKTGGLLSNEISDSISYFRSYQNITHKMELNISFKSLNNGYFNIFNNFKLRLLCYFNIKLLFRSAPKFQIFVVDFQYCHLEN